MSGYHVPVCIKCQVNMRPHFNGTYLIDMAFDPPKPYKIWSADIWDCQNCNYKIVKGFSNGYDEHFQEGFSEKLQFALRRNHVFAFEKAAHNTHYSTRNYIELEQGDLVTVYTDPITCLKREGTATLVEHINGEKWVVQFESVDKHGSEPMVEREVSAQYGWMEGP